MFRFFARKAQTSDSSGHSSLTALCCVLALIAGCALYLTTHLQRSVIESSVLSLLPQDALTRAPEPLTNALVERLNQQVILLVGAPAAAEAAATAAPAAAELPRAAQAAGELVTLLQQSPWFLEVNGARDETFFQEWGRFFYEQRHAFITPDIRERLNDGSMPEYVLSQFFSSFAGVSGTELSRDPLLLTRQEQLYLSAGNTMGLDHGFLTSTDDAGTVWYFIHAQTAGSSFALNDSTNIAQSIETACSTITARYPDITILKRGAVFYSAHAAGSAFHDLTWLGSSTVLLVLILIYGAFRSLMPLLCALMSIGAGIITGVALPLLIFGTIHSFTLIVSLSVIGMACDYTLYFMSARMTSQATVLPPLRRALVSALATTAIAYVVMLFTPFPGIRQMAVLALGALAGACIFVLTVAPLLARNLTACAPNRLFTLPQRLLLTLHGQAPVTPPPTPTTAAPQPLPRRRMPQRLQLRRALPVLLALLIAASGIPQLEINDDVAALADMPPELKQEDKTIAALTGQSFDQRYLLLYANSTDQLLNLHDVVHQELLQLKADKVLSSFKAWPLNSPQRQRADCQLITRAAGDTIMTLKSYGVDLEFQKQPPCTVLTQEQYLASPAAMGFKLMSFHSGDYQALMLPLGTITDRDLLIRRINSATAVLTAPSGMEAASETTAVTETASGYADGMESRAVLIDTRHDFDQLFSAYRNALSWLLLLTLGLILVSFMVRMGLSSGVVAFLPTLMSVLTTLGILGWFGVEFNLFVLFALIMILGVGINYSLFFLSHAASVLSSFYGVTLAFLTTELTLGILALSSTPAVCSFGVTLFTGVCVAYLLSPLVLSLKTPPAAPAPTPAPAPAPAPADAPAPESADAKALSSDQGTPDAAGQEHKYS